MALVDHVFPQSGDANDSANFAQLLGQTNLYGFVGDGLTFTVDYGVPEVTVAEGIAYLGTGTETASTTSEDRTATAVVVQLASRTVALSDGTLNYIYVEPNVGTDDSPTVAAYTSTSSASPDALRIGEIDTAGDFATEQNRAASLEVEDIADVSGQTIYDSSTQKLANSVIPYTRGDNERIFFGSANNFSLSYDPDFDAIRWRDEGTATDVLEIDSVGNHHITGTYDETGAL